ncbi:putative neurofilament protein h form h2 [Golovinomyces cichoracearum]|uniref:Putative neurofilament protein h form h2 n=1 Tax=Golovinomyces cichoracearum TaxID=62708 RepID=A0A420IT00_9PEZI|nr:putative neurofilament protein h form h2 [Golovinomyces cichoracearum]
MAESTINSYSMDPTLWLYTSLTSGSSHIITATSRMETILKANRIPFKALDLATDEKARMLWGRRAGKDKSGRSRKIPGLVQMGIVIGDIVEVEDWNEYGELKEHIKVVPIPGMPVLPLAKPSKSSKIKDHVAGENKKSEAVNSIPFKEMCIEDTERNHIREKVEDANNFQVSPISLVMSQLVKEAAQKAKDNKNIKNSHEAAFSESVEAKPQKLDNFLPKEVNVEKDESYLDKRNKLNEEEGLAKINKSDKDNYLNVIEQTNYQELVNNGPHLNLEDSPADIHRFKRQLIPNGNKRNIEELTSTKVEPRNKSDSLNKIRTASDSKSQNLSSKEPSKRPAVILPPDTIYAQNIYDDDNNNASSLKPPNTISRKKSILQFVSFQDTADRVESIQSPNSTAWKPASLDQTLREVALADKVREVLKKS